jgi:hypothetical protein
MFRIQDTGFGNDFFPPFGKEWCIQRQSSMKIELEVHGLTVLTAYKPEI